jgi:hypothetical protein
MLRILAVLGILFASDFSYAQVKSADEAQTTSVPFVGCRSDGQVGLREPPPSPPVMIRVDANASQLLAYYRAERGVGVLAPRGWHCFGVYGSGGATLYITPTPIDPKDLSTRQKEGFKGPVIRTSYIHGDTSGRFIVAEMISRVFPERKAFLERVIEDFDLQKTRFPAGPYPGDSLTYKSPTQVEFTTPSNTEGLGTWRSLAVENRPIQGAAILDGETPDLVHVPVRLPAEFARLAPLIVRQLEAETATRP